MPTIVFHENHSLLTSVLLANMDIPAHANATRAVADRAAQNLRRFLRDEGYERAFTEVVAEEGVLHVFVDEGRFERISFHGQGSWKTVRLKLELRIPEGAFNRIRIDHEMARLKKKYAIRNLRWEVRESKGGLATKGKPRSQAGLSVQELSARPPSSYELHVFIDDGAWGQGLGVGLLTGGPDGLGIKLSWSHDALFFDSDRYQLDTLLGSWIRRSLDGGSLRPVLTHAEQRLRWLTPPLAGDWLRLDLRGAVGTQHVQRADLRIDSAWRWSLDCSVNLDLQPLPFLETTIGAGYRLDGAARLKMASGVRQVPADERSRGFVSLSATADQASPTLRSDRSRYVTLEGRYDGLFGSTPIIRVSGEARSRIDFGWNEMIFRGRGAWVGGPGVVWWDEEGITSEAFRVAPPGVGYARGMLQAAIEYRQSLWRDSWKLGGFTNASLHGAGTPGSAMEHRIGFAAVAGLSLHVLLLDVFQLDAYYGVALDQSARVGQGFMLALRKIY